MKKRSASLALAALSAAMLSSPAAATCYLIYTPANELVWRATTPPVALDGSELNAAVQRRVPQGHLVISNDNVAPCPALDLTKPRLTLSEKAAQARVD